MSGKIFSNAGVDFEFTKLTLDKSIFFDCNLKIAELHIFSFISIV